MFGSTVSLRWTIAFREDFARRRAQRFGAILLLLAFASGVYAQSPLEAADADALSGDTDRIRRAIGAYQRLDTQDPEIQWRLLRAYYNYQDELTDLDRADDQTWACDEGHEWAGKMGVDASEQPELVYYSGVILGCYLRFHLSAAIGQSGDLLEALERARRLDPKVNDGGPDRALGVLYLQMPLWLKDSARGLRHLEAAVAIAPHRGGNRAWLAKALVDNGRERDAMAHIEFIRAGNYTVSSAHWRQLYARRIEDLAAEIVHSDADDARR